MSARNGRRMRESHAIIVHYNHTVQFQGSTKTTAQLHLVIRRMSWRWLLASASWCHNETGLALDFRQ